jgi:hypothetical protein
MKSSAALVSVPTTVVVAENILDKSTWVNYPVENGLENFLVNTLIPKFGGKLPETARIYHEKVDQQNDVTPSATDPESINRLTQLTGTLYVVVWPNGQAVAVQMGIALALFLVATVIKAVLPDEKVKNRQLPKGSPNNLPGDRQNTARVLQRIPDIYGTVKSTPDLIQYPYISYENNLQIETVFGVIGRGEYFIDEDEIFEGQTPVKFIEGHSISIYPPGEVPGTGTPQLEVGEPIEDSVLVVYPVKEITGQPLLPPNNTVIFGDEEYDKEADEYFSDTPKAPLFEYLGAGVGTITFTLGDWNLPEPKENYILDTFAVGDKIGLDWKGRVYTPPGDTLSQEAYWGAVSVNHFDLTMGDDTNIPNLQLLPETPDDDHYVITAIDDTLPDSGVMITISVPASKQAEWEKIILFNDGSHGGDAASGTMYNRQIILYLLNYRVGPFFVNDPGMEEIHINLVAEQGLWVDDGQKQDVYGRFVGDAGGIEIAIEVTPADETGAANGTKEIFYHTVPGSATKRDFIGSTVKLTPTVPGRFIIGIYRNTLGYWRRVALSWKHPVSSDDTRNWYEASNARPFSDNGDPTTFDPSGPMYEAINATFADGIKVTHIYSMSSAKYLSSAITDFGNLTTVHCRSSQLRNSAASTVEKRLNMIVTRKIPIWVTDDFIAANPTSRGLDAIFHILQDPLLGNVPAEEIDFPGIADAFAAVDLAFADTTATRFSETFDSENSSLEDMVSAVGESCFVTFYRQGNIIKARADVSTENSTLIFNHRNKLPGSETRQVGFGLGAEENYDGVEVEYTDEVDETIKIYGLPAPGTMRNPRKIRVAGVRIRAKAAMHAWRAFNRILYQREHTEFEACEEAALGLVKDKVLVANSTRPIFQDGDITDIDGLTVHTSQAVDLSGTGDYTLFVQNVDGTTQALPVEAADTDFSLVLGGAPSGSLVIDRDAGIFPRYILSQDLGTLPKAFQIVETNFKSRGVYSVSAVNYTEGYFFNDAIWLYLPFLSVSAFPPIDFFADLSPYNHLPEDDGLITVVPDTDRGFVLQSFDTSSWVDYEEFEHVFAQDYTLAVWLNREIGSNTFLFFALNVGELSIFLNNTGLLFVEHNNTEYMDAIDIGIELGVWQHLAITYDSSGQILRAYVDGAEAAVSLDALPPDSDIEGLRVFQGLQGKADEYRWYRKCQSAEFIRELYNKTKKRGPV